MEELLLLICAKKTVILSPQNEGMGLDSLMVAYASPDVLAP